MPAELAGASSAPNLDPAVHVLRWPAPARGSAAATTWSTQRRGDGGGGRGGRSRRRAAAAPRWTPRSRAANHDPAGTWDPVIDYAMMCRNVRGFMSLFHRGKPVVCKVHGFCVAGGTDMALCSDLLVIAEDAKIGYPPARVWGVADDDAVGAPDRRAARQAAAVHRRLDVRREAVEWGLAIEAPPAAELDERFEDLLAADRADAGQPAHDAQAVDQPDALRAGPARHAGAGHLLRRHRPPHAPRATRSSATPPSTDSARRCASGTSRSATPGWSRFADLNLGDVDIPGCRKRTSPTNSSS